MPRQMLSLLALGLVPLSPLVAQDDWPIHPPAQTHVDSERLRIPIIPDVEGRPAVTAMVNGTGPWRFRIDWGANAFVVSDSLARVLELPRTGEVRSPTGFLPVVSVDSLRLGGARFLGLRAAVGGFSDPTSDGVLGFTVFADLLMTFDFPTNTLVLERGELADPDGESILALAKPDEARLDYLGIPMDARDRLDTQPHINFRLGGLDGSAVMDTQAGGFLYLPDSLMRDFSGISDTSEMLGRGPQMGTMTLRELRVAEPLTVGGYTVQKPLVTFRNRPGPMLGMGFLGQFAVTLDQRNARVRFKRADRTFTPPEAPWEREGERPVVENAAEYAGDYGNRRVTLEEGTLFLQRTDHTPAPTPGRQVIAPKLALMPAGEDEFTIPRIPQALVRFVRDASGTIVGVRVHQLNGTWEESTRR